MDKKINAFKALGEVNRIRILLMLMHKSLCVCELTQILQLSTSTVSKHLSILKNAGFITYEKDGKWINYKIVKNSDTELVNNLLSDLSKWFEDEAIIKSDLSKVVGVDRNIICNLSEEVKVMN